MKILRLFDSLKFLRTIFVAVACAFFIFPAHAELRDDELPNGYKRLTDVVFDGNTYYETNQSLYGTDTLTVRLSNTKTTGQNVIGAYSGSGNSARNFSLFIYGNGSSSDAYLRHGTILSRPHYGTGARTLVIGPTGTSGFAENTTYSAETFETTSTFWIGGLPNSSSPKYTGNIVGNITVGDRLKYIPCERTSDGAIGYYETVNKVFLENLGSGTPTTSGYDASHMIEVSDNSIIHSGYTELEYLESTGTQYIDTNATLNTSTDDVEIVFQAVSDNITNANINLFGARSTTTSNAYTLGVVNGGWRFGWGNSSPSFGTANTNKHTARIEHNNGVLKIDDTVIATSGNASITTPTTATLFAIQTNGNVHIYYGTFKIYSYKKWTNDILIQNFVPVRRDSDGALGMYDLMDSNPATAFHTNAGTGTFIAGEYQIKIATTHYNEIKFAPVETRLDAAVAAVNTVVTQTMTQAQAIDTIATSKQTRPDEGCTAKYCLLVEDENGTPHWYPIAGANGVAHALPAGYTELQYIESTGTQYIDTGLKGTQDTKVVLDFQLSGYNDKGYILGSRTSQNTNAFIIGSNDAKFSGDDASFPFAQFDSVTPTNVQQVSKFDLNRHVYELSSGGFYIDGVLYITYSNPTNFSTPENITLFGRYSAGNFAYGIFRAYGLKLYNGNNLVRDLIPARNSSGVVGMYDLADSNPETAFHTNAGTGTFTAGPDM